MSVQSILRAHLDAYPQMQITDAVKLAYQSAFGCGHLLPPQGDVARYISDEMARTPQREGAPLFTPIGGRLCRLELASPQARALGAQAIARMMRMTNDRVLTRPDNAARFDAALSQLDALGAFDREALQAYLADYRAQGCPPVSHSPAYRAAYEPAYRVVLTDLALLAPLILRIGAGEAVVAIDGPCGSGKSTLAALLAQWFGVTPIPMDDFFLPPALRTPERLGQPGGNVHHERFAAEVIGSLLRGGDIAWQRYDCQTGALLPRCIPRGQVCVIEGSYSHHPAFEAAYEQLGVIRVCIGVEEDEQLRRLARRDAGMFSRFVETWIPLEKKYFQAYDILGRAHVSITSA